MLRDIIDGVKSQINNLVLNRENMTELALAAFFTGGHILLSGPSGIGKTEWALALAQSLGMSCNQERFIPDTQPYEVFGTHTFDYQSSNAELRPGPMFAHVFLAEGIENAHPRVKTVLMDAIEKKCAAIEGKCYPMPEPFFVIATSEAPDTLPDSLRDRFMLTIPINYPGLAAEKQLLQMHHHGQAPIQPVPVCNPEAIAQAKEEVQAISVEEGIFNYIISIVETTRRVGAVQVGASPRGSLALLQAAKACAAIKGRDFVKTEDVRDMANAVLGHRIKLRPEALQEGLKADNIIESILAGKKTV